MSYIVCRNDIIWTPTRVPFAHESVYMPWPERVNLVRSATNGLKFLTCPVDYPSDKDGPFEVQVPDGILNLGWRKGYATVPLCIKAGIIDEGLELATNEHLRKGGVFEFFDKWAGMSLGGFAVRMHLDARTYLAESLPGIYRGNVALIGTTEGAKTVDLPEDPKEIRGVTGIDADGVGYFASYPPRIEARIKAGVCVMPGCESPLAGPTRFFCPEHLREGWTTRSKATEAYHPLDKEVVDLK